MSILERVSRRVRRWEFERSVRAMTSTPAIVPGGRPLIALSMVHHRDVLPYLLAVKSFARFASPSRIVMVADPTIDDSDRALVRRHVPFIEIRDAREFQREGIPTGGTWERLCAISEHVRDAYVVQLDADTVTTAPVTEVIEAVERGTPFALATDDAWQVPCSCAEIAAWARTRLGGGDHIQLVAESLMDRIDAPGITRYVRGCSGFAGFPRASFDFAMLRSVSESMAALMGDRWREWGSEQVASNLVVANLPGGTLLPHARYCAPHRRRPQTAFLHFIGYVRFTTGLYSELARKVASELRESAPAATGASPVGSVR